jgi:hypothetical protein
MEHLNKPIVELSMAVTKASFDKDSGEKRIRMAASDTGEDFFGERMSTELFHNFVRRMNEPLPEAWRSVIEELSWSGGMPYASISHYKSGANESNLAADIQKV